MLKRYSVSLPKWLPAAVCAIALAVFTHWSYREAGALQGVYDDAYITFRYAMNLAVGNGLVFNVGEYTDSASSLLHVAMLALGYFAGFHDLEAFARVLGLSCLACTVGIVGLACHRESRSLLCAIALAIAVGLNGMSSGWAINGMETPLFAALTTAAVWRLLLLRRLGWVEAVVVALLTLVRVEGALWLGIWMAIALRRYRTTMDRSTDRRALFVQAGLVTATAVGFGCFKYVKYDTILPHAFRLKQLTTLYLPNPLAVLEEWKSSAMGLLLFGSIGLLQWPRDFEAWVLRMFVALSALSVALGPYAEWGRYSAHLLPVTAILAARPLGKLIRSLSALALVVCVFTVSQAWASFQGTRADTVTLGYHQACRKQVGRFLDAHFPPGTTVLSSDIGAIAYAAPRTRFVDSVGLTSRSVLELRARGQNIDGLLEAKKLSVIADTCAGSCRQADQYSAYAWMSRENYWTTPLPETTYFDRFEAQAPLVQCHSPDTIGFAVIDLLPEPAKHGG